MTIGGAVGQFGFYPNHVAAMVSPLVTHEGGERAVIIRMTGNFVTQMEGHAVHTSEELEMDVVVTDDSLEGVVREILMARAELYSTGEVEHEKREAPT